MRIKTANNLRKEITALDLAIKMLRAENEGMRRSVVTLKMAIDAPLALWESHWFENLPKAEQELIRRTANNIAAALKPAPIVNNTITSATPVKTVSSTTVKPYKPLKQTRQRSAATNATKPWTKAEDAKLMRMVKANEPNVHIADVLGRSVGACAQRVQILKKRKK